jgi:hypothetical protein
MNYLVSLDHNNMTVHLTRSDCEGFQKVLYIQCSGWDWCYEVEWQWKKGMGMLRASAKKKFMKLKE